MRRKGVGYIIEVMASLLVLFIFVIGNVPEPPADDLKTLKKKATSQDLTITLKKSGDLEYFLSNGGTGSLETTAETMTRSEIDVSGTVSNLPIEETIVGFHVLDQGDRRRNISLTDASTTGDHCSDTGDLEEINSDSPILTNISRLDSNEPPVYVADTNPDVRNDTAKYDTVYVDNGTRCQFSSEEGPYYIEDFFRLADGSGDHYDIKNIYSDSELEIYKATQVIDIGEQLKSRVNGIDPEVETDTVAAEKEDLVEYDTLVFRERESVLRMMDPNAELNSTDIRRFMDREGKVMILAELRKQDFYTGGSLDNNFITKTGMKWVDISHSPVSGANFTDNRFSKEAEAYFSGYYGSEQEKNQALESLSINPGGKISSSNSPMFKKKPPMVRSESGVYQNSEFNATNYTMDKVDIESQAKGFPKTECVETPEFNTTNLTRGRFNFYDYRDDQNVEYKVINTELGDSDSFCKNNNVRAANIDLNGNGWFNDSGEGPYLENESLKVEGRNYSIHFPGKPGSLKNGTKLEFNYTGEESVELVNYRTSVEGIEGGRLVRMNYENSYSQDERRLIAAMLHWVSDENKKFGERKGSGVSTETVGGIAGKSFIPYRLSMRWK
ncbi:MAG: hypothetical protein ABEJ56_04775 [Candidatus Nanohaloarchaea archaeon]